MIKEFGDTIFAEISPSNKTKVTKSIALPPEHIESENEQLEDLKRALKERFGADRVTVKIHKGYGGGLHQLIVVVSP